MGVSRISSPSDRHPLGRQVDLEVLGPDQRVLGLGMVAPDRSAQAGHQLPHAERLGHVVIGSGVERLDLVGLLTADRQDDDRHLGPSPQADHDLDAVDARQADVQEHDVRTVGRGPLQGLLARRGHVDVVAPGRQVDLERLADLGLVVDHQHPGHGRAPLASPASMSAVAPPPSESPPAPSRHPSCGVADFATDAPSVSPCVALRRVPVRCCRASPEAGGTSRSGHRPACRPDRVLHRWP